MKNLNKRSVPFRMVKNSMTHNILMITKFYDNLVTFADLDTIHPKKYKDRNKVRRSLLSLQLHNFILLNDNESWIITPNGKNFLYEFAERQKLKTRID
jgi:hypothetical protein